MTGVRLQEDISMLTPQYQQLQICRPIGQSPPPPRPPVPPEPRPSWPITAAHSPGVVLHMDEQSPFPPGPEHLRAATPSQRVKPVLL